MPNADLSPQNFLLMIENSSALAGFWSDLRDCYLPRLVDQLRGSHPENLTNIFISESRCAYDLHGSRIRQSSSLKDGLKQFEFNYDLDNTLSTIQIQTAVEFLSSPALAISQVRHLIVVAATPPTECMNCSLHDPWHELANMITQGDIHLHLALTSNLRSGSLPNLFEKTLQWLQNIEEPLWLPNYSTAFIFRVVAQQTYADSVFSGTKAGPSTCVPGAPSDLIPPDLYTTKPLDDTSSESPILVSQTRQFHRLKKKVYDRNTAVLSGTKAGPSTCVPGAPSDLIPPDLYTTKPLDDVSSESPSLVSQISQFYGLKKKVYGANPPCVPFVRDVPPVRDESPVRDRYRGACARLVLPPAFPVPPQHGTPPLLARRGRARQADRAFSARHERNGKGNGDPYAPPQAPAPWYQPMSSPEGDSSDHSSYSASNLSLPPSPVTPMSATENYALAAVLNGQCQETVPLLQPSPPTATTVDDMHPSFYPPFVAPPLPTLDLMACDASQLSVICASAPFHLDPPAMSFHAAQQQALSIPLLSSTTAYIAQPPSTFDLHEFSARHVQHALQDEPAAFPFPAPAPLPPAHAPAQLPDAQRDLPIPMPIMQPMSMLPPISAQALHDRVQGLASTASQASESLCHPRRASTAARAPCATAPSTSCASGRAFMAPAPSSSSSLTGWAG
ncbi:hypothetical protein B0H17DRAFT_1190580 [Mycena rosella]|uniref:Uncharacterized protein n=1 Tax=Mycena rosella TaxID=1033263 RepID=A0AAD7MCL8_MYCRO|nr:hypothetical protein B0H17DRAFT_1190580 [Mycena rosella]